MNYSMPNKGPISQAAIDQFKQLTGTEPSSAFISWVNNTADLNYWGSRDAAIMAKAQQLNKSASDIKAEAASFGMTLSDQEAIDIRNQVDPTGMADPTRLAELSRNTLITKMTADTEAKQKEEIDKAQNPEKYLEADQLNAYKQQAATQIQSMLGREATPEEADYFANELARGTSAYELQGLLKMTPEYQSAQAEKERAAMAEESAAAQEELAGKMQGFSDEAFKRALPEIMGQYMRSGRINSSGVDSAIAKAKADLTQKQQEFLANTAYQNAQQQAGYRRQDFTTNAANAYNQYLRQNEPNYQQQFNLQNAGNYAAYQSPWNTLNYAQQSSADLTSRDREISDYYRQQNDYMNALQSQNSSNRQNAVYGLAGNLLGSAANIGLMKWAGAFNRPTYSTY
jgi:hypothetical protein